MNFDFMPYLLVLIGATLSVVVAGALALDWLSRHGCRQYIRDEGPQWHSTKAGTPTLGGVFFIPPVLVVALIFGRISTLLLLLCGLVLAFMLLGLADDLLMLKRKNNLGLRARHKLALQFLIAGLFLFGLARLGLSPGLIKVPFSTYLFAIPLWLYIPFALLLIVGTSNSTNLTDGLDGLLAGLSAVAAAAFALLAHWLGQSSLAVFSLALFGGAIGFLFYNRHPARVFMGDTGSLALGAAFAGLALLLQAELLLFFLGAIFFLEVLSVIIQVISFKTTRRRVFKMSPLHHHLELSGWKEAQIVRAFWGASFVISAAALIATYLTWKPI